MASETRKNDVLLRFDVFELNVTTGELRRAGLRVSLPPQPFRILMLLASRPGELVTREEIQRQIWGSGTFVDFEAGLNYAVKKIRSALHDDAETPRYIETLPRRGYRFIGLIEAIGVNTPEEAEAQEKEDLAKSGSAQARSEKSAAHHALVADVVARVAQAALEAQKARRRWQRLTIAVLAAVLVLLLLVVLRKDVIRNLIGGNIPLSDQSTIGGVGPRMIEISGASVVGRAKYRMHDILKVAEA